MKSFATVLIVFGIVGVFQDVARAALSSEEKRVGDSIANKLDSLMGGGGGGGGSSIMGARGVAFKKSGGGRRFLDFLLLLDSSGSIGLSEFNKAKDASKVIVDYIDNKSPLSSSGSRMGLIEFSETSKTTSQFRLGQAGHQYAWQVKNAISRVNYDRGSRTATAKALNLALTEFALRGSNRNAKVVWILTDGKSNTGGSPFSPAAALKGKGVTICAVAVGKRVSMSEINGIASSGCVYRLTSFSSYKRVMQYAMKSRGVAAPQVDSDFFSGIKF